MAIRDPLPGEPYGPPARFPARRDDERITYWKAAVMADDTNEENTSNDEEQLTPEHEQQQAETVSPAQVKAMQAALRKANKEAESSRLKLRQIEDRDKTETQRIADRAADAERRAVAAETALLRTRVAVTKGLPAELADRLKGDTEAEMVADADALLALVGKSRPAAAPAVPTGARSSTGASDMNALLRKAAGRA